MIKIKEFMQKTDKRNCSKYTGYVSHAFKLWKPVSFLPYNKDNSDFNLTIQIFFFLRIVRYKLNIIIFIINVQFWERKCKCLWENWVRISVIK